MQIQTNVISYMCSAVITSSPHITNYFANLLTELVNTMYFVTIHHVMLIKLQLDLKVRQTRHVTMDGINIVCYCKIVLT